MSNAAAPGSWHTVRLDEPLTGRIEELARRCGVAPATVALAGLALLIRRYTGEPSPAIRFGDGVLRADLAVDGPVRDLFGRLGPGSEPDAGFALRVAGGELAVRGAPDEWAECFTADLVMLLGNLEPDRSTVDILPVSAYERRPTPDLARLHAGQGATVSGATIPEAFAAQVVRQPGRPAVLADDGSATYAELGSAVAGTAAALPPGASPVAVLCRHGVATVTALLAALVAGRAYVPLDPAWPETRLALMLTDAAVGAVLTDPTHAELAARLAVRSGRADLPIVHIRQSISDFDPAALRGRAGPDDPAYVLYTSGSTGTPKGVVQSHRNVLFGIANHVRNFAITPRDRTSVLTSFGFDMAVTDTFGALLSGAAAVPVDVRTNGLGHLAGALAERRVTVVHSTPTVYRYLVASLRDGRLPDVRAVLLGGEEVTRHDVTLARRHFAPGAVFVNGYGTTEISFAAQCHLPPDAPLDHAVVPIGHPLPGIDIALVDAAGRTTCLTGEIVVRTPHVALGYLGLPELTAARFGENGGVRAYRTGDLARRLPDGRLVFLGRADRLVKIRGHRVELGEVEAHLAALPGVARAAVVAQDRLGEREIIAYVVPVDRTAPDPVALRRELAAVVPEFMLPRAVLPVAELPIGPTGKLDVAALPAVAAVAIGPLDPLERVITSIWCDVLGLAEVDRQVSFFDLGGHSLQLALVQQRLETTTGRRVPLARLVEFPTVAALAGHLGAGEPDLDPALAGVTDRMRRRRARGSAR